VVPVSAAKHRILLATLLMDANRIVSGDVLADIIWDGAPPSSARVTVRGYVKQLRQRLPPAVAARIVTRSPGYLIELGDDELDRLAFATRFRQAGAAVRQASWGPASALLAEAISLWQGPALADVPSDTLRREHGPALEEMRVQALEWRIEADLHLGRDSELVPELRALTAEYPLRERFHGQLMLAMYRGGRRAEALACFQRARRLLMDSLGVEPGTELRELHERVLGASLDLAAGAAASIGAAPGGAHPSAVPRQLPASTRHFTGRAAELDLLDELAFQAGREAGAAPVAVISGMAGVGKTSLAVHWGHRAALRFPGGQLYMNLRGFDAGGSPRRPAEVIRAFLDALGADARQVPASHQAREGLYRSMLAGLRVLIVLDNARDAAQVRPLLPGSSGSMVIVTSRSKLTGLIAAEGACPVALDVLTEDEAVGVLASRLGRGRIAAESAAATRLTELCGRLPLALAVASARAATSPGVPLAQLASRLGDSRLRMDTLETEDAAASVRAAFSWSYRQLAGPAARMFRLLAVHPGPTITAAAAASLGGVPLADARARLRELSEAHLIMEQHAGRFALHDLLRSFAAEAAAGDRQGEAAALKRVLGHYLHTACAADRLLNPARDPIALPPAPPGAGPEELTSHAQALAWFAAEREVMLAAVNLAAQQGLNEPAWQIPWAMVDFLERRGYWDDLVDTQRTALRAARRLRDPVAQARASRALGHACSQAGLMREAQQYLAQALVLFRRTGDAVAQARTHQDLSAMLDQQDRPAEALRHDLRALRMYTEAGHRAGQASALNAIGWLRARLGDYPDSVSYCTRALDMYREVGNRRGEGAALDSLGYAYHHLGEHFRAITFYQESLALFREVGDRYLEANVLTHLGDARLAAAGPGAATGDWQQALTILEDLKHPDADKVRARLSRQIV
jgi:DNA-binding SARP family transcriptional activator/tetratricopeptide (TPR) repeat protein